MLPYQDPKQPIEQRVADLLARMTREEKIGQLHQVRAAEWNVEEVRALVRAGKIGSRILASSAFAGNEAQETASIQEHNQVARIARDETRLGIPVINGRDVIHGFRTMFPIPLAQAASFDMELVEQASAVAAREARSQGVHWTFAPMLDIARDPRWGRVIEGGGEDPYLCSALGRAMVRGFQGRSAAELAGPDKLLACMKHFAGYGSAEGGRDYETGEISDHTLRNVYLPPFRAAVEAGVGSVMSAFHDFNGQSASGSHYLLTEILKEEWQFDGFVISDWASVEDLVRHRLAEGPREAAALGFEAGVDMEMVSDCYPKHLPELLASGVISEARLDDAVRRILRAKFRLGLFENPFTDETRSTPLLAPESVALARRLAARSMVLLENRGNLLPLAPSGLKIAVVGPMIEERLALLGSWTLDGLASDTPTILESIKTAAPEATIKSASEIDQAVAVARRADVVVAVVGEPQSRSGENHCVADVTLPPGQEAFIRALAEFGRPLVVVVCAGRPLALGEAARSAGALLYAWHAGTQTGPAIADLLFGKVAPSGRLPITLPRATGQIPIYYARKSRGHAHEGTSEYRDLPSEPLYRFGYGLGYTSFAYEAVELSASEIGAGETLFVSARVSNTGARAGETVAQLYVQDCVASVTRPIRELKGFERVALEPGESRPVKFALGPAELGFYGADGRYRVEPGAFKVFVGGDCAATLEAGFRVR